MEAVGLESTEHIGGVLTRHHLVDEGPVRSEVVDLLLPRPFAHAERAKATDQDDEQHEDHDDDRHNDLHTCDVPTESRLMRRRPGDGRLGEPTLDVAATRYVDVVSHNPA